MGPIMPEEINLLKSQLKKYGLDNTNLEIKHGFAYLSENVDKGKDEHLVQATLAIEAKQKEVDLLKSKLDSIASQEVVAKQIFQELKIQYPFIQSSIIQPSLVLGNDMVARQTYLLILTVSRNIPLRERSKLENWLKTRFNVPEITLVINR